MRRLLAVMALVGTAVLWPTTAGASEREVVVIGDSLTFQSLEPLRDVLAEAHIVQSPGSGLTDGAREGNPWDWTAHLTDLEATYDPDVVVIELGTNDALSVNAGEAYAPHIARVLAATDAPRVVWLDCSQHAYDPDRNAGCATIRGDLLAVEREGFTVGPYDAEVASDPDNICYDTVHLCPAGTYALADLIGRLVGSK